MLVTIINNGGDWISTTLKLNKAGGSAFGLVSATATAGVVSTDRASSSDISLRIVRASS